MHRFIETPLGSWSNLNAPRRIHAFQQCKKNSEDQPDWFRSDVTSLKAEAAAAVLALAFLLATFVAFKHSYDQVEKPTHVSKVVPKQWGFDKSYLSAKPTPWHFSSNMTIRDFAQSKNAFLRVNFSSALARRPSDLRNSIQKAQLEVWVLGGFGHVRAFFSVTFFGSHLITLVCTSG